MIVSMTGFGKALGQFGNKKVIVEIKSLNSKQTDLNARMPALYKEKEMAIRSLLYDRLERGKIECNIYVENNGAESNYAINRGLALNYYKNLKSLAEEVNEPTDQLLDAVLRLPEVVRAEREELEEKAYEFVSGLVAEACDKLVEFRAQEGAKLKTEFEGRVKGILTHFETVKAHEEERVEGVRQRITKNLDEWVDGEKLDASRLEQELIYYIEKLDITEEKVRLKAHCEYFLETLDAPKSQGKKLGFIGQEIGREINTIGSKAYHAPIQKAVVQMKDELEKIKEQVLNVL